MVQRKIRRRTMLQGAGAITVGLPLLEEMLTTRAWGAPKPQVPVRSFNVFFGLGIPAPLQQEGFEGVLEPLKPLANKLLIMRGVDQVRCDRPGINAHYDGATGAFTAEPPDGEAKAGGPSIDQVIRKSLYPREMPSHLVPTLVAGTFFRRSRVGRYVHSYNEDGSVAAAMQESPRDLFERVFGTVSVSGDEDDLRRQRLRRSVLDSVVDQYKFFTGDRSPLGNTSRARVADHLERIREYEQRAYSLERNPHGLPVPPESKVAHGGEADPGGEGIDITLTELTTEWRLLADLYALAIQMDRTRFGAITFLAAGERIRLKGTYEYAGRKVFEFDDAAQRRASGSNGCSHEWWHAFNEDKKNEQLRAHAHMKMREVAYFLQKLDSAECREPNGKTILENSLITISTESGDGRHNDVKRELSGVFHAVTPANGLFKTGQILDLGVEGIDVYNTLVSAVGSKRKLGPADRETQHVDKIRA
jgi:hypothetical protein